MAKKFFIGIFIILILYVLITALLYNIFNYEINIVKSFIISALLTTANISLAFVITMRTQNKEGANFNKVFLGSMSVRFAGLAAIIFLVIKFANIHQIGFLVSLFLLYFVFQFWEVIIINRYLDKGNSTE